MTAPRPNVRRLHPLDSYEQAMIEEPPAPGLPVRSINWLVVWSWTGAILVSLALWGLVAWRLW